MKKVAIAVAVVLVVVVVVVLASGGGGKKAPPGVLEESGGRLMTMPYARLAGSVAKVGDNNFARGQMLKGFSSYRLQDQGWVTSVEDAEGGDWLVQIDMDEPGGKDDGPEITATVSPQQAPSGKPAVGQKVEYMGRIGRVAGIAHVTIELRSTHLKVVE